MNHQEILEYICSTFNIDLRSKLLSDDILNDLMELAKEHDLNEFRLFVKKRIFYERFRHLTGYWKFLAIVEEFKKENKPKLNEQQEQIAYSYSDKLFSRTTSCFDEVDYLVQIGNDLDSMKVKAVIYNYFNGRDKDIQVLKRIGDKAKLLKYIQSNRQELKDKIIDTVVRLTLLKTYPSITHSKNEAKNTLKMLQNVMKDKKGK